MSIRSVRIHTYTNTHSPPASVRSPVTSRTHHLVHTRTASVLHTHEQATLEGGKAFLSLILVILVLRSAHLAVVVVEHQRCLDHVRERRHLHVGGKGGFPDFEKSLKNLPL